MDKELLYRFFEGNVSEEEMQEIKSWMESSPENERTFLNERKLFNAIIINGHYIKEGSQTIAAPARSRRIIREIIKIAAVVLLTIGFSQLYNHLKTHSQEIPVQAITVPPGQRVSLTLPDGTAVWLNARTTLTYPVNFNRKQRSLQLDGEAYFEVAPDASRPFIVETSSGKVEALGTAFNVEAYSFSGEFETTLMNGKVRVSLNDQPTEGIVLSPDNKATLKDGVLELEHVSDYTPYRWREGLICFKNASIASIMKEFEKYYGVEVQIRNEKVLQYYYTGKFRHTDGVDYALRVLQKDIFFEYTKDDEQQIIYID